LANELSFVIFLVYGVIKNTTQEQPGHLLYEYSSRPEVARREREQEEEEDVKLGRRYHGAAQQNR
jgi:hypothetical protein